jgi:hypothetical protein
MQDGIIAGIALRPYFKQAEKVPPIRISRAALPHQKIQSANFEAWQHIKVL